jgi:predicted O-methyltransferase YrrM
VTLAVTEDGLLPEGDPLGDRWVRCVQAARERLGPTFLEPPRADYRPDRIKTLRAATERIQGWVSEDSRRLLYQLVVDRMPPGAVVELGSWRGLSTVWLAAGAIDRGDGTRLYAVDTWVGEGWPGYAPFLAEYAPDQLFQEFIGNLEQAGVREAVEPIRATTQRAAKGWTTPIGLLFIDANHAYEAVRADLEAWGTALVPGGYIVFDDAGVWEGPTRLLLEIIGNPASPYRLVGASQNQAIFTADGRAPSPPRAGQ